MDEKHYGDPMVTYYYRIIDRLTNKPLTEFINVLDISNINLYSYGIINSIYGGYSPFIIEIEIWNNEPSFSAGFTKFYAGDAIECKLNINNDILQKDNIPFLGIRQLKKNIINNWNSNDTIIKSKTNVLTDVNKFQFTEWVYNDMTLYSDLYPNKPNFLSGIGDKFALQTSIYIPKEKDILVNTDIEHLSLNLSFSFSTWEDNGNGTN